MAFLAEQAGGMAIYGQDSVLNLTPTSLHERIPFYCGSKQMVMQLQKFLAQYPQIN